MKLRRFFVHAVLSLLLLLTQQVAVTHGYAHWAARDGGALLAQAGGEADDSGPFLSERHCSLCLSLAQIAVAVASPEIVFGFGANAFSLLAMAPILSACLRTVCVFLSRAPPQA